MKEKCENHPTMARSRLEHEVNTAQRSSHNAWLPYTSDPLLSKLMKHTATFLRIDEGLTLTLHRSVTRTIILTHGSRVY